MPLDASVTRFIGRRVRVVTVPGHGWIDKDYSPVAPLPEFFVTVARFWSFRDERRGGIQRTNCGSCSLFGVKASTTSTPILAPTSS